MAARRETGLGEWTGWRSPFMALVVMTIASEIAFATWWTLAKNFAVNALGFTGAQVGIQESIREIPGFLAFLVVYVLLAMREQTLALAALALMGLGVAVTGWFPSVWGFYLTTFVMSLGFHYFQTMNQSLQLQWLPKATAPRLLGRLVGAAAIAQLAAYGLIFITWKTLHLSFTSVFAVAGTLTLGLAIFVWVAWPSFRADTLQHKHLILRRRYWLYYLLTFMGGARRQIFTVFAGLLMVTRFGYEVPDIAALFLINCLFHMVLAPKVGAAIMRFGERRALIFEYAGLIAVFTAYAFVSNPIVAAGLYVIDHAFFALAFAINTYFQKIADPADIAPTSGVSFTINHVAAVGIPVLFGLIWLWSPKIVFLAGAGMAVISLILAFLVPRDPCAGQETTLSRLDISGVQPQAAE